MAFQRLRQLDLQAKTSLILVAVILPTFLILTWAENQLTRPLLEEELKQVGITTGRTLAAEIVGQKMFQARNPTARIEGYIQELLYAQPNINRVEVTFKDPNSSEVKVIASSIEEDPSAPSPTPVLSDILLAEYRMDEVGLGYWDITVPIEQSRGYDANWSRKLIGNVHLAVSTKLVSRVIGTLARIKAIGASLSVVILILFLSYFLRKTIGNERLLKRAESQNLQLTEQLAEVQRQLLNTEKLAVMGQLTASFAHEIGTPLNSIGGHLQLLGEEVRSERIGVIQSQVEKIAGIVRGFLQSTAQPSSQRQLVDLNRLCDQILTIQGPRLDSIGIEVKRSYQSQMGPVRAVPLELEQILLNLTNNSVDSIRYKQKAKKGSQWFSPVLELGTGTQVEGGKSFACISVYDSGEGIRTDDLGKVLKPFYTTKGPGEGTGLGLTICEQLARKHGGMLEIKSQEGRWTRVTLKLPYQ